MLQISIIEQVTPKAGQMFNLAVLIVAGIFVYVSYYLARKGRQWTIRPLEAIEAIQEGIGRAAEMNRPVLMFPGIGNLQNVQTIAGLTMLGEIVERGSTCKCPREHDPKLHGDRYRLRGHSQGCVQSSGKT